MGFLEDRNFQILLVLFIFVNLQDGISTYLLIGRLGYSQEFNQLIILLGQKYGSALGILMVKIIGTAVLFVPFIYLTKKISKYYLLVTDIVILALTFGNWLIYFS